MQVRFLLGPAGTGKTFRCLEEIRAELKRDPSGPPLLFLAPKQATFQIERQLLADAGLRGYTRLQILSFDRLAEFVLDVLGKTPREILSEEGRVMIVRALLSAHQDSLKTFRSTARMPGFAQQFAAFLRELQHEQLGPERIAQIAKDSARLSPALRDKLHDAAILLAAYRGWLRDNRLDDAGTRLDLATEALQQSVRDRSERAAAVVPSPTAGFQVWLDGFAEMTPQELNLLAALLPCCERATLAFCLEAEPVEQSSWLSLWTVVAQTCREVRDRVTRLPGVNISVEVLRRQNGPGRFTRAALAHLEANWAQPVAFGGDLENAVALAECADATAEAVLAAREIRRFVRTGGRYRECAVLMRSLDRYHDVVRRVFTRYGIPMFLDRRETITHHPLAELTRFALRVAAYGWQHSDWLGALKTGLVDPDDDAMDELENEALAHGWEREQWLRPFPAEEGPHRLEALRVRIVPPFVRFGEALHGSFNGIQMAAAIRRLWLDLGVEATLARWTEDARKIAPLAASVHGSVRDEIEPWLENVERAFAREAMPIPEWLPILEAGLAGLTVGVIPPALDQVLVGSIDRSRNPDLRLTIALGWNDGVFPAPPPAPLILTEREREEFADALAHGRRGFGLSHKDRLAHERYFGYIACTRSRERLVLSWSQADARGRPLNPSPFVTILQRMFPALPVVRFEKPDWRDAEHASELAPEVIRRAGQSAEAFSAWPAFEPLVARAKIVNAASLVSSLAPEIARRIYSNPLRTSVSALEQFAACPFRFFLSKGLGLEERLEFEVDARERGKFQHDILSEFHAQATREGRRWRDWLPADAARLVGEIGAEKSRTFGGGIFNHNAQRRFAAETLIGYLQRLVSTLVGWMAQYGFDPAQVELAFGFEKDSLPGWTIDLGEGRTLVLCGRVDRVDLCARPDGQGHLAVVIDYKSSSRKVDNSRLFHGLELQLLSYLGWLRQAAPGDLGAKALIPAGVFYVGLKPQTKTAPSRRDALEDAESLRRKAFQHAGRFDTTWRDLFSHDGGNEQFNMGGDNDPCDAAAFGALVDDVEKHLRTFGRRILEGAIDIAPYQKGKEVACTHCDFTAICRFDPWTQPYRVLAAPAGTTPAKRAKKGRA